MIAFSAHHREKLNHELQDGKTYFIDLKLMKKPILITRHTNART